MPSDHQFTFREGTPADAEALAAIGAAAFPLGHAVDPSDIAEYVGTHFTSAAMAADIANSHKRFILAELNGRVIAFSVLAKHGQQVELQRIYSHPEYHGSGVAAALMAQTLDIACSDGFETIWLGVWENNHRAQAFYKKFGFAKVGQQSVAVGEDIHADDILSRSL